jgi:hypothetical protein
MSVSADLLRSIEIRARWCQLWVSPVTYDSCVGRPARVSLDDPQAARWQCLPKWGQMAFADVQDVRLAADANSYCRSGMAGCLVKDPVLSAYIASGPYRTSSRCGHDCKGSCHHLIRSECRSWLSVQPYGYACCLRELAGGDGAGADTRKNATEPPAPRAIILCVPALPRRPAIPSPVSGMRQHRGRTDALSATLRQRR